MRRSIIDFRPIVTYFVLFGLFLYLPLTSMLVYLTPLAGYIFLYIVENYTDKEKRYIIAILFVYLSLFELDRGLFVFSSLILFLLFIRFVHSELISSVACKNCLKISIIILYYISFFIINIFLSLLFNQDLPKMDITYIVYIITDIILVLL